MDQQIVDALKRHAEHIAKFQEEFQRWNEDEVKRYLIEPLLDALGWDTRNPSIVRHQYPVTMGSDIKKADYALMSKGNVVCIVEAKPRELDDDASRQALSYAVNLRTPWALATNGRHIRLYGSEFFKSQDVQSALIFDLENATDSIEASLEYLQYLAKGTLDSEGIFNTFKSLNAQQALCGFLQSKKDTLVKEVIAKWVEESWGKGPVDEALLRASLESVFGRVERIEERQVRMLPSADRKVLVSPAVTTAGDWEYRPKQGKGIFALKSDSSKTIDVSLPARQVEEQLAKLGLKLSTSKAIGGFYYTLRREAGLIK